MATIKVKLRPSRVVGKAGIIYYQITHNRKTRQITTKLRVHPTEWDTNECKLTQSAPNRTMIQTRIDSDVAVLHRIVSALDSYEKAYTVRRARKCHVEVVNLYPAPQLDLEF